MILGGAVGAAVAADDAPDDFGRAAASAFALRVASTPSKA